MLSLDLPGLSRGLVLVGLLLVLRQLEPGVGQLLLQGPLGLLLLLQLLRHGGARLLQRSQLGVEAQLLPGLLLQQGIGLGQLGLQTLGVLSSHTNSIHQLVSDRIRCEKKRKYVENPQEIQTFKNMALYVTTYCPRI